MTRAIALALMSLLSLGCAGVRLAQRLEVPKRGRLYVAVFVDETESGEVGVPLADAVKLELFRSEPELLSVVFDEDSIALDGTVHALEERPVGGERLLLVRASARLIDRQGNLVADLGDVRARARYPFASAVAARREARARALEIALRSLAREILIRMDREARAQRTEEQEAADA